jgi:ACR3 family arsenite efflux pump ArsB
LYAFAPIVGLLLGISAITVPWQTLVLSVALYIVVPVVIAQIVRREACTPRTRIISPRIRVMSSLILQFLSKGLTDTLVVARESQVITSRVAQHILSLTDFLLGFKSRKEKAGRVQLQAFCEIGPKAGGGMRRRDAAS